MPHMILHALVSGIRSNLPPGISSAYLDDFVDRHRDALLRILDEALATCPPTATKDRTEANLAAMTLAANPPRRLTEAHKRTLRRYSGWGGLSIRKVADRFPPNFPTPDPAGLVHEYYTPSTVTDSVVDAIEPLLATLGNRRLTALEPSAGIGRFLQSADRSTFANVDWHVIERSPLSARMLAATRPDLDVFEGPFERWVADNPDLAGRIDLILANPPYGPRGASITDDPDRRYREKQAWAYFLRRSLDLLAPGGLGVFLIPAGFLTGTSARIRNLRDKVLFRHHLVSAFRLPSGLFPGAHLVTDLLFFRARGGTLAQLDPADHAIVDGRYFLEFPDHILGEEVGKERGGTDQTKKPRWGYQVVGEFTGLPPLVERPICSECVISLPKPKSTRPKQKPVAQVSDEVERALALGDRVDRYLALLGRESLATQDLWPELKADLDAWARLHGNPHRNVTLRGLAKKDRLAARFLAAFERTGDLIDGIATKPLVQPRYQGRLDDVVAQAELLWRTERRVPLSRLLELHRSVGGSHRTQRSVLDTLPNTMWALDGNQVLPMADYLTGHLWPRVDRAREGSQREQAQVQQLLDVIEPAIFDDIEGVSPRQGWVPLELVQDWLTEALNEHYRSLRLTRMDGLVQVEGVDYDRIRDALLSAEARWCIGWINHDKTVFRPSKRRHENLDEVRLAHAAQWKRSFHDWCARVEERRTAIEDAYNRAFRGYVAPTYSDAPLPMSRWNNDDISLHPHQAAGARRLLANRGGLLAFDVGVGKTYTGLAVLARARQEGWCRRPVIVVPNSIAWKWAGDIERVLPDYRYAVIGSKRTTIRRGKRKGQETSVTDTPADRAAKWTRLQSGELDVVLLTYSALARTQMNPDTVKRYAERTEAIQREVRLRQRNASKSKRLTERQEAVLAEGVAAWVAEMMELPPNWEHDPGIHWDDLGIDLLMVDEAQNFKNLYLPEAREGGVPRFMGNAGPGSKRAWQLDFRAAAVRENTGGAGIVLLSATPAKNSPLELYNLVQYIDHDVWARQGIRDPEQFIDRYLRIELKPVVDTKMDVVERSAVTGFQNLHELRDTLFRYAEFKTAEDVGLKLPEPTVEMVEVDMDRRQNDKYDDYVGQIEAAMSSTNSSDKGQILGLLARLSLTAVHADLDEGWSWKSANDVASPHSPKFDALARRVGMNRTCGHIVFIDNIAAHRWVKTVLVENGVPAKRIAVLNAHTAKASADRQRIAQQFNGSDEEPPKYDLLIANAIAYEGIDLQRRTCAIHHLDLPWEPATLQQRNGRGVRQGNTLNAIEIAYYFARRSMDGLRFNLIQGKLGWMTELLKSQERATNNPGAQMELGPEEILLLVSRDPEKTAARLAEVKARKAAEARAKLAKDAARLLRSANARFRKAERAEPENAERLRAEGEERLADLERLDPEAWPWARWVGAVRRTEVLVPPDGEAPVFEGLRVTVPSPITGEPEHGEFGRVLAGTIGFRPSGAVAWGMRTLEEVVAMRLEPEGMGVPAFDMLERETLEAGIRQRLRYGGVWDSLGWTRASDDWVAEAWALAGDVVVEMLESWSQQALPVVRDGELRVLQPRHRRGERVLAPTLEGFREFLGLVSGSREKRGVLRVVASRWWARRSGFGAPL